MRRDEYYAEQKAAIRSALERSMVLVACDALDDDTIDGWACIEGSALHYVYVVRELRGHGVARALLSEADITHYTHKSAELTKAPPRSWAYNPFRFWSPPPAKAGKAAA